MLFLTLALVACGSVKKKKENIKRDTETVIIDEVNETIIDRIDTTILIDGDSVNLETTIDDLIQEGEITVSNGNTTVKLSYDKEAGVLTAKGITENRYIPVEAERTTHRNNKTITNVKESESITQNDISRDNTAIAVLIFKFCLLLILIASLAWWLYKKIF